MSEYKPKLPIVDGDLGPQNRLKGGFDEPEVRAEALVQLRRFEPPAIVCSGLLAG